MVEESTLRELRQRYSAMVAQAKQLVHADDAETEAVPGTIDAEVIFCLLVQQGRVVDSIADESSEKSLGRRAPRLSKEGMGAPGMAPARPVHVPACSDS